MIFEYWENRSNRLSKLLGDKDLSKSQKAELNAFWKQFIKIDYDEHKFYLNACKNFDVRYIPSSIHYTIIDKYFNDWEKAKFIDNKAEYSRLFPEVQQPKSILTRCNGFWYENGTIMSDSRVVDIVLQHLPCFIKKATESEGGKGVYYIGKDATFIELVNLLDELKGDIVVQTAISQSSELSVLNSTSVNTIRMMTLLNLDGSVKLCSSCLRMGVDGAKVDNASSGGVVAGIDEGGRLKKYAYKPTGESYIKHPTSGVLFEDFQIPNFDKCKEFVMNLAPHYPYFRLISWDIALNQDNEPILVEANLSSGELDFHQLNNGPIFGDDTEKILSEVISKRK